MSKNQHNPNQFVFNQNNQTSEDPRDGGRGSDTTGRAGKKTAAERSPEEEKQDQSAIESFGKQGSGTVSKE